MARDDHELLIRIDERVVTVFNKMSEFETMFTNHLSHHESWENDIRGAMRWWIGTMVSLMGALFLLIAGVI